MLPVIREQVPGLVDDVGDLFGLVSDHGYPAIRIAQRRVDDEPVAFLELPWPARVFDVVPDRAHCVLLTRGGNRRKRVAQHLLPGIAGISGVAREGFEDVAPKDLCELATGGLEVAIVHIEDHAVWRQQRHSARQHTEYFLV